MLLRDDLCQPSNWYTHYVQEQIIAECQGTVLRWPIGEVSVSIVQ